MYNNQHLSKKDSYTTAKKLERAKAIMGGGRETQQHLKNFPCCVKIVSSWVK